MRRLYYTLFRWQLRVRCWLFDFLPSDGSDFPMPPAMLRFRVSETLSTRIFEQVGKASVCLIEEHLRLAGANLAGARTILDFGCGCGCGCGRTLRWLRRGYPGQELYGVDVDAEAIAWCRRNIAEVVFRRIIASPPMPFPDGYFDVVYGISVFTHLDEVMQDLWLAELKRVVRPGGVVLITVHGDAATHVLNAESIATLRSTGVLHRRSLKLKGLLPDWYHTTFHTEEYLTRRMSAWFSDVSYRADANSSQDVVVGKVPLGV